MPINTLMAARRLTKSGMPEKQAEVLVELIDGGGDDALREEVNGRFNKVDGQFNKVDGQFTDLKAVQAKQAEDIAELKAGQERIEARQKKLEVGQAKIEGVQEGHTQSIAELKAGQERIEKVVTRLEEAARMRDFYQGVLLVGIFLLVLGPVIGQLLAP